MNILVANRYPHKATMARYLPDRMLVSLIEDDPFIFLMKAALLVQAGPEDVLEP